MVGGGGGGGGGGCISEAAVQAVKSVSTSPRAVHNSYYQIIHQAKMACKYTEGAFYYY